MSSNRKRSKATKGKWQHNYTEERIQQELESIFLEDEPNGFRRQKMQIQEPCKVEEVNVAFPKYRHSYLLRKNLAQATDYPLQYCKPARTIVLGQVNSFLFTEGTFFDFLSGTKSIHAKKVTCKCQNNRCKAKYCNCLSWGQACDATCGCINCLNNQQQKDVAEKGKVKCRCTRRTKCLKKYCECRKFGKKCSKDCECFGCRNGSMDVEESESEEISSDSSS